jgi:uncharacterized membrane protein YozB (DUF420 family)
MDANVTTKVRSPLAFFAMTVLTCNTVFGICASVMKDPDLFIYCMHMFLAIVFFLGSLIIWTPLCLYHPKESSENKLPYHPWVPTVTFFLGLIIYLIYHFLSFKLGK